LYLQYPQGVTTRNQKGKIPLHYAAREGRTEMVQYFLQHHPETCSITTDKGKLAIHFASGDGHTQITSLLLQAYPDSAAIPTHKGKLALHFCARWGYMDIAYELLSIFPNAVRALDWEGSLPLHDAAREGQYLMSKYLIHQYPTALQTANLRGEIPLFSAVRSSCVDLIVLLIQSWPRSGRHVLRNVCVDDYISSWNWNIIELLLRGATNNLHGCSLLVGREPPTVRLTEDIEPITVATFTVEEMKARKKAKKAATRAAIVSSVPPAQYPAVQAPNLAPPGPLPIQHSSAHASMPPEHSRMRGVYGLSTEHVPSSDAKPTVSVKDGPLVRSSSPILQERDAKPTANKRGVLKRPRVVGIASPTSQPRTFIALHAAFECKASFYVIDRILQERPNDVHRVDELGRMAIHFAVAQCHDNAIVEMVLNPAYKILTPRSVRMIDGASGKLPIHIAIATGADVRIIKALLQEFPSSGVAQCRTPDYFYDKTPVHMATHYACDVSTVFELLRVDPSFVTQNR
jgi:ankyrin repeat protein